MLQRTRHFVVLLNKESRRRKIFERRSFLGLRNAFTLTDGLRYLSCLNCFAFALLAECNIRQLLMDVPEALLDVGDCTDGRAHLGEPHDGPPVFRRLGVERHWNIGRFFLYGIAFPYVSIGKSLERLLSCWGGLHSGACCNARCMQVRNDANLRGRLVAFQRQHSAKVLL